MAKSKELVKTDNALPAFLANANVPTGMEEAESSDFVIPMLRIIQKGSPQIDDSSPKYNEHARVGQITNTATGELADELVVVPVYFKKRDIEWVPREQGGGFVAEHFCGTKKVAQRDGGKEYLENGNQLVKTYYIYVLIQPSNEMAIIPFSGSGLRIGRQWLTLAQSTPNIPLCAFTYLLSTVTESNALGSWKNFKLKKLDHVTEETFNRAQEFMEMIQNEEVKADHSEDNSGTNAETKF